MTKRMIILGGVLMAGLALVPARPVPAMDPMFRGPSPLIGKPLPDFQITDIAMNKQTFSEIRGDKGAILFFWATWCPHCRTQLQEIERSDAAFEKAGTRIILINVGERRKDVAAYMQRAGMPVEGYLDWDGAVSDKFGVYGLPTFIVLNKEGVVTAVQHHLPDVPSGIE